MMLIITLASVSPSYSIELQSVMRQVANQVIADMAAMIQPYGSIMVLSLSVYLGLNFFIWQIHNILPFHTLETATDAERASIMMSQYDAISSAAAHEDDISEVILTHPEFAAQFFGSSEAASDYVDRLFDESSRLDGVRRADLEERLFLDSWRDSTREMRNRFEYMDVIRANPELIDEFFGSASAARESMANLFDDDLVFRRMPRNPDYEPRYNRKYKGDGD